MNKWSQLRPLSKLDQLAEPKPVATIMKTAFLVSLRSAEILPRQQAGHHVIKSYLNHKGVHFIVVNRVGEFGK
jgi:hypothetical protein